MQSRLFYVGVLVFASSTLNAEPIAVVQRVPLGILNTPADQNDLQSTSFAQFDPNLGTLQSIGVSFSGEGQSQYDVIDGDDATYSAVNTFTLTAGTGSASDSWVYSNSGLSGVSAPAAIATALNVSSSDFQAFSGTGLVDLQSLLFVDRSAVLDCTITCLLLDSAAVNGDIELQYLFEPSSQDIAWTQTRPLNHFNTPADQNDLQSTSFAQFDPNLGTLQSIGVSFSGEGQNQYDVIDGDDATYSAVNTFTLTAGTGSASDSWVYSNSGLSGVSAPAAIATALNVSSSDFQAFSGTGLVDLQSLLFVDRSAVLDCTITCLLLDSAAVNGDITITYSFNVGAVSVPEPAPIWLFGLGLLVLIGISRRRDSA